MRLWWNWQTRYFEVVVGQPVQVQVLLSAPLFLKHMVIRALYSASRTKLAKMGENCFPGILQIVDFSITTWNMRASGSGPSWAVKSMPRLHRSHEHAARSDTLPLAA